MRLTAIGCILVLGCAGTTQELEDRAGSERKSAAAEVGACAAARAKKLVWDATQITYDYQPLTAAALIERSTSIVRGRLTSLSARNGAGVGGERTVFTVKVEDVYKGDARPGEIVNVLQARSPSVTDETLAEIERELPEVSLTLFVFPSEVDQGYLLASMQGLVVASDCGVEQPFGDAPIFAEAGSDAEFDAALRAAIEQTNH